MHHREILEIRTGGVHRGYILVDDCGPTSVSIHIHIFPGDRVLSVFKVLKRSLCEGLKTYFRIRGITTIVTFVEMDNAPGKHLMDFLRVQTKGYYIGSTLTEGD